MKYWMLTFGMIMFLQVQSQHVKLRFCVKNDGVVPALDNQGKDQRHKGAVKIDSIVVETFGVFPRQVLHRIGVDNKSEFDDGLWVDGCSGENNSCNNCGSCGNPTVNGDDGGALTGTFEDNVRVRSANNNLYIESTHLKEVCYTTAPLDIWRAGGKFIKITVDYAGSQEDGFSTKHLNIGYILEDNVYHSFIIKNSNFIGEFSDQVVSREVIRVSTNDLDELVHLEINPNPVADAMYFQLQSKEAMKLKLSISDHLGRILKMKDLSIEQGNNTDEWDVANLPSGNYVLIVDNGDRRMTKQFVKN